MHRLAIQYLKSLSGESLIEHLRNENYVEEADILRRINFDGIKFMGASEIDLIKLGLNPKQTKQILDCKENILNTNNRSTPKLIYPTPKGFNPGFNHLISNEPRNMCNPKTTVSQKPYTFSSLQNLNENIDTSVHTPKQHLPNRSKPNEFQCELAASMLQRSSRLSCTNENKILNFPKKKIGGSIDSIASLSFSAADTKPYDVHNKPIEKDESDAVTSSLVTETINSQQCEHLDTSLKYIESMIASESLHIIDPIRYRDLISDDQKEDYGSFWNDEIFLPPPPVEFGLSEENKGIIESSLNKDALPKPPPLDSLTEEDLAETQWCLQNLEHWLTSPQERNYRKSRYYRNVDRDGAIDLLRSIPNLKDGAFIFRNLRGSSSLAITVHQKGVFYNIAVKHNEDGTFYCDTNNNDQILAFKTLEDFVMYYKTNNMLSIELEGSNIDLYLEDVILP